MISTTLVLYFLLALGVSFLCSTLEAVLLSTSRSHIEILRQRGKPAGAILHRLKQRIDRPLIGILTLNTIANMFGSAGVGAETARLASAQGIPDALPVAIAAGTLTFCILVFSEIIPKTVGATYWRQLAAPSARIIQALMILLGPLIRLLEVIPRSISRQGARATVSRDEIAVLAQMGSEAGSLPARESEVIANLLRLSAVRAKDVMTPRVDMFALPASMTAQQFADQHPDLRHSRIPVYGQSVDQVTGVVLKTRVLEACLRGNGSRTLDELKGPVHIVPETKTLASLLDVFVKRDEHLFLVVDEYGGTEGIVTLEDVIETLLGVEIFDELDGIERLRRIALHRLHASPRPRPARESSKTETTHADAKRDDPLR